MHADATPGGEPTEPFRRPPGGIFTSKGTRLSIPIGGLRLRLTDEGRLDGDLTLHVSVDMCSRWVAIGQSHVEAVGEAHAEVLAAWATPDDDRLRRALEAEFSAGVQCAVAAAVAVDAFYSRVREHTKLPKGLVDTWRTNRTSRQVQIAEVLRRAFRLSPVNTKGLRSVLHELFRFRNWAVHPPSEAKAPAWYADIQLSTEWRYVTYRAEQARTLYKLALGALVALVERCPTGNSHLREYADALGAELGPYRLAWEERYGSVYDVTNGGEPGAGEATSD